MTTRLEQIDIVASNIVLSETDNGHGQADFSVMVSCLFRNISRELGDLLPICNSALRHLFAREIPADLDFLYKISLESGKDNLSLTRFETVRHRRDRSDIVGHGEKNQFLVDKVLYGNSVDIVIKVGSRLEAQSVNETCVYL